MPCHSMRNLEHDNDLKQTLLPSIVNRTIFWEASYVAEFMFEYTTD